MAASVTLANTKLGFTAIVNNMNVTLQLQAIKSVDIVVNECTYGTISAYTFKLKLNFLFTTFKVFINKLIGTKNIVVPSHIGNLFTLSDLYIEYYNGYIYAGATPTFIGSPAEAAAMYYSKQMPQL